VRLLSQTGHILRTGLILREAKARDFLWQTNRHSGSPRLNPISLFRVRSSNAPLNEFGGFPYATPRAARRGLELSARLSCPGDYQHLTACFDESCSPADFAGEHPGANRPWILVIPLIDRLIRSGPRCDGADRRR